MLNNKLVKLASDNRIEDEGESSNQLALPVEKFGVAAEDEQPPALPPRTTSIQRSAASGFAKKSPLKANTGSSGSVRKSPLKTAQYTFYKKQGFEIVSI